MDDRSLLARNAFGSREQLNRNTVTKQNQLNNECIITRKSLGISKLVTAGRNRNTFLATTPKPTLRPNHDFNRLLVWDYFLGCKAVGVYSWAHEAITEPKQWIYGAWYFIDFYANRTRCRGYYFQAILLYFLYATKTENKEFEMLNYIWQIYYMGRQQPYRDRRAIHDAASKFSSCYK